MMFPTYEPHPSETLPGYITTYKSDDGRVEVNCLDGVDWLDAPLPHRFHKCSPQVIGLTNWFERVERCACGAIRLKRQWGWQERNSRRKS